MNPSMWYTTAEAQTVIVVWILCTESIPPSGAFGYRDEENLESNAYFFTARFHGICVALLCRNLDALSICILTVSDLIGDTGEIVSVVLLSAVVAHGDMKRK
jgi:hypothetical protein